MRSSRDRETIVIVDDAMATVKVLRKRLESWGYRVVVATSGEAALRLAEAEHPDLILLDLVMPQMKGWEVCARLKANQATCEIPVIFITALGLPDHIAGGMKLGAEDYIVKPYDPDELKARLALCLLRHRSAVLTGDSCEDR